MTLLQSIHVHRPDPVGSGSEAGLIRPALRTALVLVLLAAAASPARAQTADALFDSGTVQEIRLFVNSRDLRLLRERFQENTYYPADFHWQDVRVRNVAIRSRGTGSRNPVKPGLRIDFNRYASGQNLLGLESIVLDNAWQDPAMMRERLTMEVFARMGQAAPRESFCRLYINNEYQGLHAIVESIDADFISRTLGESGGYLYEYNWVAPYYGEFLGDDPGQWAPLFEPETHQLEAPSALYSPLRDLFRAANEPDPGLWRQRTEAHVDLPQLVTYTAIENCLSENDGFLGYAGMNNFYLYRHVGTTRHRLLPWDKDTAFLQPDSHVLQRTDQNVLIRMALNDGELYGLYLGVLEQCAAVTDDWLLGAIDRTYAAIAGAVYEDPRKPYSNEEFEMAVESLRDFARRRPSFIRDQVRQLR